MQFFLVTATVLAALSTFVGATPLARQDYCGTSWKVCSLALLHHPQFTEP